ncbi:MAG: hypothetical protein ACD_30C00005G0001 [uncultured bacterium]|uniref:Filamentous hemagglutinin family outer membrane protein n=4 Tax=Candidatus Daviesiibacteriota TaxID=1752718 RepID=A0A0G0F1I6_9BACT|nr:MAG: hypothetical protein ACD_30C00005G0001 [uncultured bacterium]KKQ07505.1 MAG: Filamentous hemagglutinin family outer membrane protein [Candidatus Daviesbacteria bacterium GW2011_GWB1_36_5]KKQ15132.1 MAG: Filamentous hemagglutinin family outer membrane protein [Candidatus Daviesbacteria bacterium GW2011_GWA1_36_8]OGE16623.1 MAG: hypothetical protein A2858_02140 [Candidatus Daviesbacteria bacterium RIFCSPHIGHO2_01_FULL_36_37]OGE33361.1 MAG: hypothetical protein A3C99_01570 [Candidatus Davi
MLSRLFNSAKNTLKLQNGIVHLIPLILLAALGLVAYLFISSSAPFKDNLFSFLYQKPSSQADVTGTVCQNTTTGTACVYVSPVTTQATQNQNFQVQVRVNTNGEPINAVEAVVNYPIASLEYVSIDGTGSSFGLEVPTTTSPGSVTISRGTVAPVNGDGLIATLTFKPIIASGVAAISFSAASQAISSNSNSNILQNRGDGTINIGSQTGSASFTLISNTNPVTVGQEFLVTLQAQSDQDAANLFDAKLSFDAAKLEVVRLEPTGSFITQWAEQFYDNATGEVSLLGGVPSPGIQTSGSGVKMMAFTFKAKTAGPTTISILPTSGILRNSDNQDILGSTTDLALTLQSGATPTPSPSPTPTGSAGPTPTPSPTPSPTPVPTCTLTNAAWITPSNPVMQGSLVTIRVTGSSACNGRQVTFEVREDDGILGFNSVLNNPVTATFVGTTANSAWVSEFQDDGVGGINNPPEYYYIASLVGSGLTLNSSDPKLEVTKPGVGEFRKGDGNKDGRVDRIDLSVMMTNWAKTTGLPTEIDINDDSLINAVDFSALVLILKQEGVIK